MPSTPSPLAPDVVLENRGLKRKLNRLLTDARNNEGRLQRFQTLELRLLGCHSLTELMHMLVHHSRNTFRWDQVSVVLRDDNYEILRLLEQLGTDQYDPRQLILADRVDYLHEACGPERRACLGTYGRALHGHLFPGLARPLASVAVLPLTRGERELGSLNLGSADPYRFQAGAAADFLEHLAAVMAVCIENTVIQERLKHAGLTDALTGVHNRRYFDQRLTEEVARSLRSRQSLSCLFIDIDHFKRINDTHGHPVGDLALQRVAGLIRDQLRRADVVARYGGEEFAVLLVQTGSEMALDIAQRIRRSVDACASLGLDAMPDPVTVSIGVASLTPVKPQGDLHELGKALLNAADAALYQAKDEGRNRVICGPAAPA
jgi:two-component system cell cycle response regulator